MPIPEFNEIKAPALQLLSDGKAVKSADFHEPLADHFGLTSDEKSELLPSGTQRRWNNRVQWALYDLFRAGLLEKPKRGMYVISDKGRKVAQQNAKIIDREFLMQFQEFAEWTEGSRKQNSQGSGSDETKPTSLAASTASTPEEAIEAVHQLIQNALRKDLLDLVKRIDPLRFEQLVLALLLAMGYGGSREEAALESKVLSHSGSWLRPQHASIAHCIV